MKRTVPNPPLAGQSRFARLLWVYASARALTMRSVPALSAVGLVIALPLAQRAVRAFIVRTWLPLREMRSLIRRCLLGLRKKIERAAREILHALQSVAVTVTALLLVWGFALSELIHQFVAALRESADIASSTEDEFTGGAEVEAGFLDEEDFPPFARAAV